MNSGVKWFSNHWFLFCFVFASGSAFAYQEVQRQTLEKVVIKQAFISNEQVKVNHAIIRLEERSQSMRDTQKNIEDKLEMIIRLQLKAADDGGV